MAKKTKWDGSAPFGLLKWERDEGPVYALINYPDHRHKEVWAGQRFYKAKVTVLSSQRGRSAANFRVLVEPYSQKSTETFLSFEATLFMVDLLGAIACAAPLDREKGKLVLYGVWHHAKRGQNYGIRMSHSIVKGEGHALE